MVNHNGQNGNGMAGYIKALLTPTGKKSGDRRSWSISIENTWVPFFTATNVMGETNLEPEVLGMPLRLAKSKDGAIRFSDSGRPVMRVAPELNAQIGIVRENFVASLQHYTGIVQTERTDDYTKQVAAAEAAALPILEASELEVAEAVELLRAMEAAKNSHVPDTLPDPPAEAPAKGKKREMVAA